MAERSTEALTPNNTTPANADSKNGSEQADKKTDIIDLDKAEKFIFNGEELTPEELNRSFMRQDDYTRKTQALAAESKYIDNLAADLEYVADNPDKVEAFKQTYPEKFHKYLKFTSFKQAQAKAEDDLAEEYDLPKDVKDKLAKLDEIDKKFKQQEAINAKKEQDIALQHLESVLDEFAPKYPFAPEAEVLAIVDALAVENAENPRFKMTKSSWERVYKTVNDHFYKKYDTQYRSQMESQLKDGDRASDGLPGGQAPGRAPKKIKLSDVAEYMIQDMASKAR